jgi:archaeosortase B (VPXXXP-CTERM-specific)
MKKARKRQATDTFSGRKAILKTVLLFLFLSFILNFAYFKIMGEQIIPRFFTASLVASLLGFFGVNAAADKALILVNGHPILDIIGECTGIFSIIVYTACVFSYPTSLKKKGIGLIGIPILYSITLIRLISTALVGVFYPSILDVFHTYLWQLFLIIFVVILWLMWIEYVVK